MAAAKRPRKIALALYTVRDHCEEPRQIAQTFRKVREIGYEGIELSARGVMEMDPPDVRKMAADAGLDIVGTHVGLQALRDDLPAQIDRLHGWGCPYATIPYLGEEEWNKPGGWKRLAKEFTRIGKKLAAEGIRLQYHNHHFEFNRVGARGGRGGQVGLAVLFENSDPAVVGSQLDLAWIARGGGDPTAWARWLKGRAEQVHAKDWGIVGREPTWMPIGEGNMNWPEILKACRKAGVKHYLVEQDNCPTTSSEFKAAEISYRNLREFGL